MLYAGRCMHTTVQLLFSEVLFADDASTPMRMHEHGLMVQWRHPRWKLMTTKLLVVENPDGNERRRSAMSKITTVTSKNVLLQHK